MTGAVIGVDLRALPYAARQGRKLLLPLAERVALVALPSSSPAHTTPLASKMAAWGVLRDFL